MNVTTINITTVRLSNTESEVNYESGRTNLRIELVRYANASKPYLACNDVVVNLSF